MRKLNNGIRLAIAVDLGNLYGDFSELLCSFYIGYLGVRLHILLLIAMPNWLIYAYIVDLVVGECNHQLSEFRLCPYREVGEHMH